MQEKASVGKLISKLEIQIKRKLGGYFWGRHLSVFKGQGMNFKNIRQYQAGDEIRHIDWKVTARTGRVHVKEFEQESELEVYLILDTSSSMYFGHDGKYKIDKMAELVNLLGQLLIKEEDKFGLIISQANVTKIIKPGKGYAQLKLILKEISRIKPEKNNKFILINAINKFLDIHKRTGACIIISDFMDYMNDATELTTAVRKVSIKNEVFMLQVLDKFEISIGELPEVELEDLETGLTKKVSVDKEMASKYQQEIASKISQLHLGFRKSRAVSGLVVTNSEAIRVLIKIFSSRKSLAL